MTSLLWLPSLISLALLYFTIKWMINLLALTKENRIITSMLLKTVLEYCQQKGVEIDIHKIRREVEESVNR